jgi:hypothetical protein
MCVQFERQRFVPQSTGHSRFFGIEMGKMKTVTRDGASKTGVVGKWWQVDSETSMLFRSFIHQEAQCCQLLVIEGCYGHCCFNVTPIVSSGLLLMKLKHGMTERWLSRGAVLKRFFFVFDLK